MIVKRWPSDTAELIRAEAPDIVEYLLDDQLDDASLVAHLRRHYREILELDYPGAWAYHRGESRDELSFFTIPWRGFACMRMLDHLDHEGEHFADGNLHGREVMSEPIANLRRLARGEACDVTDDFVRDVVHLLRQLNGSDVQVLPSRPQVLNWMARHPSGLDDDVIAWRTANRERIIGLLVERIRAGGSAPGPKTQGRYRFEDGTSDVRARKQVRAWWREDRFQLRFAARSADAVNEYLGNSVDADTLRIMHDAEGRGIPVFATPYFLSLIDTRPPQEREHPWADEPLRSYLFYSRDLVDEFGSVNAWEKEDVVEPGKPNEAGYVLPSHTIHRRYPDVAIFIPDTMGRACGGLCAYCQRMYDFQRGRFNFNLAELRPARRWPELLRESMEYFRSDPDLQDILITGGDSLMSSVVSLRRILEAVLEMAAAKRRDNAGRAPGERFAEIRRVRLGTKLPVYLPQRVTAELAAMLRQFAIDAHEVGITQCVVQTHISSAMEVTPDMTAAIRRLLETGWAVTNQSVFTVAVSRRGHTAKLREVLGDIGVLPYYTFSVKGYHENREMFATNARSTQEQVEEKSIGRVATRHHNLLRSFIANAPEMPELIDSFRLADQIPFLATDRNMLNLPGVGKSNSFRTIGITSDGRRILEFEFDRTRPHSAVIEDMGSVVAVESKSIAEYLRQLEAMGEDPDEYANLWGYSAGHVERRCPVFEPTPPNRMTLLRADVQRPVP